MKEVDGVLTCGDALPNLDKVQGDADSIDMDAKWVESQIRDRASAELEQAHGRLRPVHRTKPARSLHIGRVRPGGAAWACDVKVQVVEAGSRRIRNTSTMNAEEVRSVVDKLKQWQGFTTDGAAQDAMAEYLGCCKRSIQRYCPSRNWPLGERAIPQSYADRLRNWLRDLNEDYFEKLCGTAAA
jgi:hypothetical protein